jgi:hypothetical protein
MSRFAQLAASAILGMTVILPAQALELLPGLWEITSDNAVAESEQMPGIPDLLDRLDSLPEDERKAMKEILDAQGIRLAVNGIRMCISEAQAKSWELRFKDEPGCTQEITERSDDRWAFRYQCPDVKGSGETRLLSEREFVSVINNEYAEDKRSGPARLESHGRWVSADCGGLKPVE